MVMDGAMGNLVLFPSYCILAYSLFVRCGRPHLFPCPTPTPPDYCGLYKPPFGLPGVPPLPLTAASTWGRQLRPGSAGWWGWGCSLLGFREA